MIKPRERFIVIDLGTQIDEHRRFAVWDVSVSRFWKIKSQQTWTSVGAFIAHCKTVPDFHLDQVACIAEQATILGFDEDETP